MLYRATEDAVEDGTNTASHEQLSLIDTVTAPGYVYLYLKNDEVGREVYFDDFKVERVKSPIIQSDDYYPFGLATNSYQRESFLNNQYQYNGKEIQDELNIGWLDYGTRQFDPLIGRFLSIDRAADLMRRFAPYVYTLNNPLRFTDPDGMMPEDFDNYFGGTDKHFGDEHLKGRSQHNQWNELTGTPFQGKRNEGDPPSEDKDDLSTHFGGFKAASKSFVYAWNEMGRNLMHGVRHAYHDAFGIESNILILGNSSGSENYGTQELGLGDTFVVDLSNPENILAMLAKIGNKDLLGSEFALVGTKEDRYAVIYLNHVPKTGETIDGWTFTDCIYSGVQVGGQVHASPDKTKLGDVYSIHQGDEGKFVLIKAGQHD